MATTAVAMDLTKRSETALETLQTFRDRIVSQSAATEAMVDMLEAYQAGFCEGGHPAGNALFLGPTGSGKTHVVECFAQALFGSKQAMLKVDCAEFSHGHEIAKLVGSPPGYLGHRETNPLFTQETLNKWHTENLKLGIVLFDEIEKASDTLWNLLLGILDKAVVTLGDNRRVDFSQTMIFLTSNLGARDMAKRGFGFGSVEEEVDQARKDAIAKSAAKSKFSPEFMNRLDHIITFHTLTEGHMKKILDIQLREMSLRMLMGCYTKFNFFVSPAAKKVILEEGYSKEYGARALKRTLARRIENPLAKLVTSGQISDGDRIVIDAVTGEEQFKFYNEKFKLVVNPQEGK